jgi:DUF1680 family protein
MSPFSSLSSLSGMTRRKFLNASVAATACSVLPGGYAAELLSSGSDQPAGKSTLNPNWKDEGVLDLTNSPHAKLKTVPIRSVEIKQGFWSPRRATNVSSSIPSMHDELLEHGRMDNFLRLENRSSAPQRGPVYSDSDVYKWAEAVGFAMQSEPLPELRRTTDDMIQTVVAAQEKSGYLNTYFVGEHLSQRMQPKIQEGGHELYCIGHLLQGAIAYYRATGDPTLLNAGMRFIDDFLLPDYGPGPNQKAIVAGHPEIEMSLIELYRTTGNRRYLDLAGYILHGDDRLHLRPESIVYLYCGIPFTSRTKLEGHAVRAMYACCGATDYYLETGDPEYWKTLNHLWQDLSEHQMYITGGVGARSDGESFGNPYELPNAQAYGESCAAIGNVMWNWRMLAASGESRFADVMERALYNGINSGMSLDGKLYCYRNPLAHDSSTGDKIRNPWYDTTCCPPNLERTLAALPGYFYSTSDDGVYVHLYDNSEMNWRLHTGTALHIKQETNYPWEGDVRLHVHLAAPESFTLYVRIPAWSRKTAVTLNDKPIEDVKAGEYLPIHNHWSGHDHVEISFDMQPQLVHANPAVVDDMGRVAIQRGPIVYCMEQLDQTAGREPIEFYGYTAQLTSDTMHKFEPELLGGVVTLEHPGSFAGAPKSDALYLTGQPTPAADAKATSLKLIPYYAWANREDSSMQVWIPYVRA